MGRAQITREKPTRAPRPAPIIDKVDWECQVMTHFAAANMGCRRRVSSGLDWVFDTVEQAIILEDDCLPHPELLPLL